MSAEPSAAPSPPELWRNHNFALLFSAQVVSLLGSGVTTVGLALFAWRLTGGVAATAVLGNALMLRILAFLIFSQPAGVIADRVRRKRVLIAADLARVALLGLFPFLSAVWQVYALVFAINAVTAFFTPTFEASVPEVVGNERYVQALAWGRVAVDAEAVAAPALAGLLIALVGARWVFWFDAATYLVSALLVAATHMPQAARGAEALSWRAFADEITHGVRVLLRENSLRRALLLSVAEATAGAAAIVVTVAYVREVLRGSERDVTVVMAGVGFGSALVALVLGRATGRYERGALDPAVLHGRRHAWAGRALGLGGVLLAASLAPGVLRPPLVAFGLLWVLNGAGQALVAIPSTTLLAEHAAPEERGRAYAAHFALTHTCWLVAYPAVGHAAARWGAPKTFTGAGVVCALVALVALAMMRDASGVRPHRHGA